MRKGMGKGTGKGYKNMIGVDKKIHSMSAKGIKQPQKINPLITNKIKSNSKGIKKKMIGWKKIHSNEPEFFNFFSNDRSIWINARKDESIDVEKSYGKPIWRLQLGGRNIDTKSLGVFYTKKEALDSTKKYMEQHPNI